MVAKAIFVTLLISFFFNQKMHIWYLGNYKQTNKRKRKKKYVF